MAANQELTPGFMVVHGNHMEQLRDLVVAWMQRYPLAPLENETVLVHSNGIAQWLKLALASDEGLGIAAAVQVELPARFTWQMYRRALGDEAIAARSPLDKQPLTWRLMRLLPDLLDDPVYAPLAQFLGDDPDLRKRLQLAQRLADLFDQYQVYRADWLADWAAGRDQLQGLRGPAQAMPLASRWQPALWRALADDLGAQSASGSRASVHQAFMAAMRSGDGPGGLPRRVIVFGLSSLPAQTMEALAALSRVSQVLLLVHNPCRHHWADVVADRELLTHQFRRHERKTPMPAQDMDYLLHQHAHPLLAAWGKQGRDYISLLDAHDDPASYRDRFEAIQQRIDLFASGDCGHLLGQLQDDILELRPLAETRETWPAVAVQDDHSIRFHVAHSALREVEILHDQLLARFNADPDLRPRDIIVMVPQIDDYAPHIEAVFGQLPTGDMRSIPFTIADQRQRGSEPVLIALEQLLGLPHSRITASEVLGLLEVPALRARFGIDVNDLPLLQRWIDGAGIRWGLDDDWRAARGQSAGLEQNTWRFGLRRMLLGYASGQGEAWKEIEPYDEVGGLDAALLGPLLRLLEAVEEAAGQLAGQYDAQGWTELLRGLLQRFFIAADEHDEALLIRLQETLDEWLQLCDEAQLHEQLPLTVVREAWLEAQDGRQLSQRFLAGAVNFCTLMPMRAIPFRVVALLGMNDGQYPRASTHMDFDLMAHDYRPGDRSRREDDRYLLLDALLAARDHLHVSWVGRSNRDNAVQPPSVLVAQLRDHLAAGWRLAGHDDTPGAGQALLDAMTSEHPLQPFSRQYFDPQQSSLFTYAHEWASLHAAAPGSPAAVALAPLTDATLDASTLHRFLRSPVDAFFGTRLSVHLDERVAEGSDEEVFVHDPLQRHGLRARALETAQRILEIAPDISVDTAIADATVRLQRSGMLPMAGFGDQLRDELRQTLTDQMRRLRRAQEIWPKTMPGRQVRVMVGDTMLEHVFADLRSDGRGGLARVGLAVGTLAPAKKSTGANFKWHRVLAAWINSVLASAGSEPLATMLIAEDASLMFPPVLDATSAERQLELWAGAWQAGMQRPLPVCMHTAIAWLQARKGRSDPLIRARQAYEGGYDDVTAGLDRSAALRRQYPDFDALVADGEFFTLAENLYGAMLEQTPHNIAAQLDEVPA